MSLFDFIFGKKKNERPAVEKERQHNRDLERQLASKSNYTSTFIIIAIIALIIGFIIAQIIN